MSRLRGGLEKVKSFLRRDSGLGGYSIGMGEGRGLSRLTYGLESTLPGEGMGCGHNRDWELGKGSFQDNEKPGWLPVEHSK